MQGTDGEPRAIPTSEELVRARVPGCSVAVAGIAAVGGADATDRIMSWVVGETASGRALRVDDRLQVGSTSKLVAAVAGLSCVADGIVGLDTDLRPHLDGTDLLDGLAGARLTVRAVLSHSTGLGVHGFLGHPTAALPTRLETLRGASGSGPVSVEHRPGTYAYSGAAYEVLALALEHVTGRSFTELVAERVLAPAGMLESGFVEALDVTADRHSGGAFDGAPLGNDGFQYHPEHAAAGLWSTAADIARLLVELTRARAGTSSLLPRDLARLMTTPTGLVDDATGDSVGLGCFLRTSGGRRWMRHGGRNVGYCSTNLALVDAPDGLRMSSNPLVAVALTNGFPGGTSLGESVCARLVDS